MRLKKSAESAEKYQGTWSAFSDAKSSSQKKTENDYAFMKERANTMGISKSSEFAPRAVNLDDEEAWQASHASQINSNVQSKNSSRGREILFIQQEFDGAVEKDNMTESGTQDMTGRGAQDDRYQGRKQ